jgi:tetratricopeptide (TPR) repeat protein
MTIAGEKLDEGGSKSCPKSVSKTAGLSDDLKSAAACVRAGQWHMVEEFGNQMAIQFPADPWGAYFLSLSSEHNKDWPRARWMAELAVKKAPGEGLCLYQLGRLQWSMGEKLTALDTLKKAAAQNASLIDANVLMGQIAMLDQRKSDAEKSFLKAYDRDSQNLAALMGLAEVYRLQRNWPSSEKYLRRAISAHPHHLDARLQLAQGLETFAQDMAGALSIYREIQSLDRKKELDGSATFDLNTKIQTLQATVAEQMKRKMSERKPSAEGKVSK